MSPTLDLAALDVRNLLTDSDGRHLAGVLEDAKFKAVPIMCPEPEFAIRASELVGGVRGAWDHGNKRQAVGLLHELGSCLRAELNWWDGGRGHEVAAAIYQRAILDVLGFMGLRWATDGSRSQ